VAVEEDRNSAWSANAIAIRPRPERRKHGAPFSTVRIEGRAEQNDAYNGTWGEWNWFHFGGDGDYSRSTKNERQLRLEEL
jgi:hypothetical protein